MRHLPVVAVLLSLSIRGAVAQNTTAPAYPQIKGYFSVLHPIATLDQDTVIYNLVNSYTVLVPVGLNLLKSDHIGFSFELAPTIKVENGQDRVTSLLFHPGILFRRSHGFTFATRLAFETNGRYGITPIFNQVVVKRTDVSYFVAGSLPARFGNNKPGTIGIAVQLGVNF
ncbi:MAG: hypothetical protein KA352_11900 [Flavobacteriales bacterium]|nr:hypothetical protein [Flavobacteriales bacterium]